ncbi:MAG: hypothetical protein SFV18_21080 [Bryobacteraceae bacterium]|nr:hypothetical protein [Bryobacteraceae bacterium]
MKFLVLAAACAALAFGQTANPKQPKPKSQKEVDALNAVLTAQDPDSRIAAADALIAKFADTEFKGLALFYATASAQQKNDAEKIIIYGERTLEADPQNYGAMLIMAQTLAARTREFDFDKEEKLTKAEKYANDALKMVPNAPKLNPQIPDEQWNAIKKDFEAQGHEALGLAAMVRKKTDVAIAELKLAIEAQPQKDPATMVRLASALNDAGKHDEAIAVCDQISAMADAQPAIKQAAGQQKVRAVTAKAQKK